MTTPLRTDYPDTGGAATKWTGKDANAVSKRVNDNTTAAARASADAAAATTAAAAAIPKNVGTAKGDLGVFNGISWIRLPAGSNGQVPMYDSTAPLGIKAGTVATSNPIDLGDNYFDYDTDGFGIFIPSGTSGGSGGSQSALVIQLTAASALSGHRAVTVDDGGNLVYASALTAAHLNRPVWLTTAAVASGALSSVVVSGLVVEPSWNWTAGQPLFLGANGALVQAPPDSAAFIRRIGDVVSATTVVFNPQPPIKV